MGDRAVRAVINMFAVLGMLLLVSGVLPVGRWLEQPLVVSEPVRSADAIVILSGGITDNDTLSLTSTQRLVHGLRLFKRGLAPVVILTGANPDDPRVPEADVMAKVARELGIPPFSVIVDRDGERTATQAAAVARIARERNVRSILLVTSPAHSYRAVHVFRRAGLTVVAATPAPKSTRTGRLIVLRPPDVLSRLGYLSPVIYEYGAIALYRWRGWL